MALEGLCRFHSDSVLGAHNSVLLTVVGAKSDFKVNGNVDQDGEAQDQV